MNGRILNLQFLYKFLLATFVVSFSVVALVSPFYFSVNAQVFNADHAPTNLDLTTDSGHKGNDNITNDNTPSIRFCAPRGQYTKLYRRVGTDGQEALHTSAIFVPGTTVSGSTLCPANTGRAEMSITVLPALSDGVYEVFARSHGTEASVDTEGNISTPTVEITIDTTAPTFVRATRVDDDTINYYLTEGLRAIGGSFDLAVQNALTHTPSLGDIVVTATSTIAEREGRFFILDFSDVYATITNGVGQEISIAYEKTEPTESIPTGRGFIDEAGNELVTHTATVNYLPEVEAINLDQSGSHIITVKDPNVGDTLTAKWKYTTDATKCDATNYSSISGTAKVITLGGDNNTARTGTIDYSGGTDGEFICVKASDGTGADVYAASDAISLPEITPTISIDTVSDDGYVNAAEASNGLTITGTSTNINNNEDIDIEFSSANISDTTAIVSTSSEGDTWTVGIPAGQIQAATEGTLTVTASYNGETSVTQTFIYDSTAPTADTIATTDASTIVINLSEDVTDSGTVAVGDFTVSGNTVSGVTLTDARTITLTVGTAIVNGNEITIEYTGSTLADTAGNTLSIPANSGVTNNVQAPAASTNSAPVIAEIFLSFLPATTRDHIIRVTDQNNGDDLTVHWGYVDAQATCDATGFPSGEGTEITLGGAVSDNAAGREATITYSGETNNGKWICARVGDGEATVYGVSTAAIAGLTDTAVVSITTIGGESTTEGLVYINDAEDDGNIVVEGAVVGIADNEQISVVVDRIGSTALDAKIATITSSGWSITISSEELKTTLGEGDVRVTATHAITTTSGQLSFTYDATAPTVTNGTAGQTAIVDVLFELIIPINIFSTSVLDPTTITGNADSVSWLSYNTAERKFFGTPVVGDVGNTSSIIVTGTDLAGNTVTDSFIITVVAANTTPTDITLSGATDDAKSIAENITTVGTFSTTDDDDSDIHRYTLVSGTGGGDNEDFTLTEGGELSFSSIPNHEDADDSDTDNVYNIRVQTDDQNGGILAQTFTITVTDVDENDANLTNLEVDGATLAEAFGVDRVVYTSTVDSTVTSVTVTPTVSHPEATVTVAGTTVASESASGAITLTAGDDTEILVEVTAEDGSTKTYTITITRTAAPTITITTPISTDGYVNLAESIDSDGLTITGTSTNINNGYTITLTISDTDGTTADVTKSTTVVAGTGGAADTWETTLTSTEMQGLAEGEITVTATYTNAADEVQTFTYDRTAPTALTLEITDTGTSSDNITSNAEVTVVGTVEANAKWEYEKNNSDDWIEGSGSSFNLTIEERATYKVRQVDVAGNPSTESTEYTFTLDTTDPTTVGIPNQIATEKVDFSFSIPPNTFSDTNALTYTSSGHANGITFATNTWSAAGADLTEGTVTIVATATDPAGNTGTATFTVEISPAIPAIDSFSLTTGSAYAKTETLTFTHADNALELEAVWFPSGENNCNETSYNSVTGAGDENPITLSGTIANNSTGRTGDVTYFVPSGETAAQWNDRYVCVGVTDGTTVVTQRSNDQISGLQKNRRPTITLTPSTSYTSAKTDFELQIDVTDLDSTQGIKAKYKKIDSSASCEATTTDTGATDITGQIGSTNGKTVTITFNSEDDNDKKICVTAEDTSGIPSSETGDSASFPTPVASPAITGIDTTVPEAPTITITDTGSSNSDGITNNSTVTVGGVEANADWEYKAGTADWADGSGTTFTLSETATAQDYKVRQTDEAGNESAERVLTGIRYDETTPNETTEISSAADDIGAIQDTLNSGDITDDTIPVFSGTVSAALATDEDVVVYEGSTFLGTAIINGTNWTYTPPAQNVGTKTFKAKVVDDAGNEGQFSPEFSLTIDTTAPLKPTIGLSTNSGLSTDTITNDDDITITVEQGAKVEYSLDSGTTWTEVIASAVSTSVTQDLGASEGEVLVLTRQTDVAGNQSPDSAVFSFTYDRTAPTTTVTISSAADDIGAITDPLGSGDTTDDTIPVFSGTVSAAPATDDALAVYEGTTKLGTTTFSGTSWTYTPLVESAGAVSFTARVVDVAGNEGPASPAFTLNIDATILAPSFGSGTVENVDLLIGEPLTAVTLPASTPAGTYSIADLPVGFNFDPATREFSGTPTAAQSVTEYTYKARNSAGEATITFTIEVPTPTISITGTISDDGRINADEGAVGVVVSGTTANVYEGSDVTVSIGTYSQTVQTTNTGTWEATFSNTDGLQGLNDGDYTLTAAVTGATSATQAVSYDNTVPTITVAITHATDNVGGVLDNLNSGDTTDDDTPGFVGTISATLGTGESVAVYEGSALLGTATINGTNWTYTHSAIAEGNKVFSAKVVDLAGNEGSFSNPTFSLTIDTTTTAPSFGGATIENKSFPQSAQIITVVTLPASTPVGTYEITPTIPAGLVFNPVARTISGIPSQQQVAATYAYKSSNFVGEDVIEFTIAVPVSVVTFDLVSGDGFVNAEEDGSDLVITGTAQDLGESAGVKITVGTLSAKDANIDGDGNWEITLTPSEIQSLTPGTVTIGSVTSGVTAASSFIYDIKSPAIANTITPSTATVDAPFTLTLPISDFSDDNTPITYASDVSSISWLTFVKTSSSLTWSGIPPTVGTESVSLTATDAAGNPSVFTFSLETPKPVLAIDDVSGDNYINEEDDNSAVTISGTSTDAAVNTAVTITLGTLDSNTAQIQNDANGTWSTSFTATEVQTLTEGDVEITVSFEDADDVTKTIIYDATAPTVVSISSDDANSISITVSEDLTGTGTGFTASYGSVTDGASTDVQIVNNREIALSFSENIQRRDTITLSYSGDGLTDLAGNKLAVFSNEAVENNIRRTGGGGGGVVYVPSPNGGGGGGAPTIPDQYVDDGDEAPAISETPAQFTRNIGLGSTGPDVKRLQQFLNSQGFLIASEGPGSAGQETEFFGPGTQRALAEYQEQNNLPATGYFGPLTRQFIQDELGDPVRPRVSSEVQDQIDEIKRQIAEKERQEELRSITEKEALVESIKQQIANIEAELKRLIKEAGGAAGDEANRLQESIDAREDLIDDVKEGIEEAQNRLLLESREELVSQLIYYDGLLSQNAAELGALLDEEGSNPTPERLEELQRLIPEKRKARESLKQSRDEVQADLTKVQALEVIAAGLQAREDQLRNTEDKAGVIAIIEQNILDLEAEIVEFIRLGNIASRDGLGNGQEIYADDIRVRRDIIREARANIAKLRAYLAEENGETEEEEETPSFVEDAVVELEVNIESIQREIKALLEESNNPDSLTPEEVKDQVARREAVIVAVKKVIASIQSEIEKKQRAAENSVENVELTNNINELKQKITDEEAEISRLREEINNSPDDGVRDRLQGLIDVKEALVEEFRDGITEAENKLLVNGKDELLEQAVYFEDILSRANDELEALLEEEESDPTSERLAEIETEISEKRGIIESFENSIEGISVQLSKIQALEAIEAGIQAREDELRNTEDKEGLIDTLQRKIIGIEEEIAELVKESNTPGRGGPERFEEWIQSKRNVIEDTTNTIEKLRAYLEEERSGEVPDEDPVESSGLIVELEQDLREKEQELSDFLREVGVASGIEAEELQASIKARHDLIEEIRENVKEVQEQVLLDSKNDLVAQLVYYDEFLAETTDELEALYDEEESNSNIERLIEIRKLISEKDKLKEFFKDSIDEINVKLGRIAELEVVAAFIQAREDELRNTEDKEGLIATLEQKILDVEQEIRDLITEGNTPGRGGIERFASDIESRLDIITDTENTIEKLRAYLEEERNGN